MPITIFCNQMRSFFLVILPFYLISFETKQTAVFDLVRLKSTSALCLDGSSASYYVSRDGDPSQIFLQFEGGGWCGAKDLNSTLQSCYERSKTTHGSSLQNPQNLTVASGCLSNLDTNPFSSWKRVFIKYCDGAGHQGTRKQSVSYKGSELYFRGHNNTVEILADLEEKYRLFSGTTKVVVSGSSAGGLASFLWTQYVADRVKTGKVWGLPDSGIFYDAVNVRTDQKSYKLSLENVMKLSNAEIDPPVPDCVQQFKDSRQNCMFAQNIHQHIKVPIFPIQSLYDTWSVPNILGITCINGGSLAHCSVKERSQIEAYHKKVADLLFEIGSDDRNGFWAPACANHVYSKGSTWSSQSYRIPANSENSASESARKWIDGTGQVNRHIDQSEWPSNKPCSGIQNKFERVRCFS